MIRFFIIVSETKSTRSPQNVITARSHASATRTAAGEETTPTIAIRSGIPIRNITVSVATIRTNIAVRIRRATAIDTTISQGDKAGHPSQPPHHSTAVFCKPSLKAKK